MNCDKCKQPIHSVTLPFIPLIPAPLDYVTYSGRTYHRECFAEALQTVRVQDEKIEIHLNIKLSAIIKMVDSLWLTDDLRPVAIKLATIVAEHNHSYVTCTNDSCKRLVSRNNAIIGEKTKTYQQILMSQYGTSHDDDTSTAPEKDKSSKPRRVLYFCSKECDTHYASSLHKSLEARLNLAHMRYKEFEDTANKLSAAYCENKTDAEKEKVQKAFEIQLNMKKRLERMKCVKDIREMVKRVLGEVK